MSNSGLVREILATSVGRRLLAVVAVCSIVPLMLALLLLLRQESHDSQARLFAALQARATAIGTTLASRVDAADALLRALVARSNGDRLESLRAEALQSGMFNSVLTAREDRADIPSGLLWAGDAATDRSSEQRSALLTLATRADVSSTYLVRRVPGHSGVTTVYFELAPQWLWSPLHELDASAIVLDGRGTLLARPDSMPEGLSSMAAARIAGAPTARAQPGVRTLAWHAARRAWTGAMVDVPLSERVGADRPWHIVTFAAAPRFAAFSESLRNIALAGLGIALLLSLAASAWVGRRVLPPLQGLLDAISRIGRVRFIPQPVDARNDEFNRLAAAVNQAGARIDTEISAYETLGEIDHLLLSATEIEPVLDAILTRVALVTRCQSVGISLLDADSPTLGRVFVATSAAPCLPVVRVEFDPEMTALLASSTDAITIARCEEQRHSFLAPLREQGSEFFWVWPVMSAGRLVAVLSIGFDQAPAPDPRCARHGAQFAARLSIALSRTARDEQLYRQAHFDPLTMLPNRLLFCDRLAQELRNATETHTRGALLYIDLDHFKRVNDSVGHAAGDQLLGIVAQRLRACVKDGDTVARLAGDEFTVILRNVSEPEAASQVAERIIESLKTPVNLAGRDHHVQGSIGMTLFPDDGSSIEELMRNADGAMYRAKDMGRGRAVFFDRQLMLSRFDTTHSGLYRALRRREFSLFYQPQFSLRDGKLVGLEALLRWQTPRDGTREPADFIPAAEASGLIVDIGGWVLEAACSQLAIWREQGVAPRRLSVNVSVQQLKDPEFPRNLRRVLDKYGLPAEMLEIELTESVFADEIAGAAMRQIADSGVRLALDDFGTGYSSLNYLRQHPIHVIKIDRSFLVEVPLNAASSTLAETIITMAHALGKEVVAEGVESVEQLQFLRERGCDLAQGYHLARPLPVSQVNELLQSADAGSAPERLREAG
jgi:diguanylate cyclase (GGDEF)-like protein